MQPFNGKGPAHISLPVLSALEQIVGKAPSGRRDRIPEVVAELSRLFTRERDGLGQRYLDDPDYTAAYLSYFFPVNLSKIQVLLDELPLDTLVGVERAGLSVLDVGSGPGTGTLAVLDWLHTSHPSRTKEFTVIATDSSVRALQYCTWLWEAYCRSAEIGGAHLLTCEDDLQRLLTASRIDRIKQHGPYDVIIMANCLNELFREEADPIAGRTKFITELLSLLKPEGTVMVVEPALRETSRSLHLVRDRLLLEKRCTVYSPCLHENNCPALQHADDWCHEERAWAPPSAIREIDREVGFIKDALKFSYLLLRKDGKTIVDRRPDVYRVVSELRELKGEKRAWLCNELGRQEVGRQDRLASPQNAAVDRWHRGAIVQIERIVRKEREGKVSMLGRIERDVAVKMIRPV
jgi:ribosomal protein RSM22 (predicted rRNA methylase)